jgi:hypothetical protein
MKTLQLFRFIPLFALLLCTVTACSDDDNERLSSIQETTLEGDATTLQIDMSRSDWRIASVTDLDGYSPIGSSTQLEELGTVYYGWATIKREKEKALTIEVEDNFYGTERGFIINLEMKSGFYKEQIIIHQKVCTSSLRLKSMVYSLEEGDGEKEIAGFKWSRIVNYRSDTSTEITLKPYEDGKTYCSFYSSETGAFSWVGEHIAHTVVVPIKIENGEIILDDTIMLTYSNHSTTLENKQKDVPFTFTLEPMKTNIYWGDIYYKELQVTYTLTIVNTDTHAERQFKGKFVRTYPYAYSEFHHDTKDLPEEE